jgi:hypothetical protein
MLTRRAIVTCGALIAAVAASGPQRAGAADTDAQPPIAVERCTMSESTAPPNMLTNNAQPAMASGLSILYSNGRDVAATEVDFRVHYNGQTLKLVDRGSFPPHEKLTRGFSKFNVAFAGSSADCAVTAAVFADGSHWTAPDAGASPGPVATP